MTSEQIAVVAVLVAVASIVGNFVLANKQARQVSKREHDRVLWEKIDELRDDVEYVKDTLLKEYMTQDQIREFFKLSSDGWVVKLEHIDSQIGDLKKLVEAALSSR